MEILNIGKTLNSGRVDAPDDFVLLNFFRPDNRYVFIGNTETTSISTRVIAAIAFNCAAVVLLHAGVGIYAFRQKKRAEKAIKLSKPFASWAPSGKDTGGAPELKGARWFSFDESIKAQAISRKAMRSDQEALGRSIEEFFQVGNWWQSKGQHKDPCKVGLSSRLKSSCFLGFITRTL